MDKQRERDKKNREWLLLLLLLPFGVIIMCLAGQVALSQPPTWHVQAEMDSKLDSYIALTAEFDGQINPVRSGIMTAPAWMESFLTPGAETPVTPLGSPIPDGSATPSPVATATLAGSPTPIGSPTVTLIPTTTPVPTSTIYYPPVVPTNTKVKPPAPTKTNTPVPSAPGSITIVKNSQPNSPQDFSFSGTLGSFSLDDDADGTLSNTATFTNLTSGTYTVTEGTAANWSLTGLTCVDPDGGSSTNVSSRTATIDLDAGENITCTFTNTYQYGSITIVKDSQPNSPQDFSFSGTLGTFSLDDDADGTLSNTATFTNLTSGTYTVTEGTAANWSLTGLTCVDPDGGSSTNVGTRTATIDLDAGENITCIFTNSQHGSITIIKDSQPNNAQDFSFSGTLGSFSLDDDADGTLSNTATFTSLMPGTYTVTEGAVSGWSLANLTCTDPDGGSSTNVGTRTATIDLDAGENITCTFTNTYAPPLLCTIISDKITIPNGGCTLIRNATGTHGNLYTITNPDGSVDFSWYGLDENQTSGSCTFLNKSMTVGGSLNNIAVVKLFGFTNLFIGNSSGGSVVIDIVESSWATGGCN